MDESRKAYNLTSFAAELRQAISKGDRRFEKECKLIEMFLGWLTIEQDLRDCLKSISTIASIQKDGAARANFGQALMTSAVLRYARATISRSEGRSGFNFKSVFSPAQFKKHIAIGELRSTVFAHHHIPTGEFGELWSTDLVATRSVSGRLRSTHIFDRTNFSAEAVMALQDLAQTALDAIVAAVISKKSELDNSINTSFSGNPHFRSKMEDHPFDPHKFFEYDQDFAEAFWAPGSQQLENFFVPGTNELLHPQE